MKTGTKFVKRFCYIPNTQSTNLLTHALINRGWKLQTMDGINKAYSKSNVEPLFSIYCIWLNLYFNNIRCQSLLLACETNVFILVANCSSFQLPINISSFTPLDCQEDLLSVHKVAKIYSSFWFYRNIPYLDIFLIA